MSTYEIIHDDVLKWAKTHDGPKFHALLCDPPYHLYEPRSSLDSYCGRGASGKHTGRTERDKKLRSGGFMGKKWDGGDIAFHPETWIAFTEHLFPGAFGMAFASSRGWHRLACAIEDAGLIIHPSIFGWVYGSGFPKATRIDTQVDRAAGAERDKVIDKQWTERYPNGPGGRGFHGGVGLVPDGSRNDIQMKELPATPLARTWVGHRYSLQALKPALEPIIVFQVPYIGKPIECITETGAGALNIDGARIKMGNEHSPTAKRREYGYTLNSEKARDSEARGVLRDRTDPARKAALHPSDSLGRWPANFYLDEEAASKMGEESRFFLNVDWQLEQSDPVFYCAKASRKERDVGLEEMKEKEMGRHQSSLDGGVMLTGSGNERSNSRRNHHPTVKPLKLTQWLATLLLPPVEYAPRRILVPFAGSGSEMIGAALAGWEEIVGIEAEAEYVEIAKARLEYWTKRDEQLELIP